MALRPASNFVSAWLVMLVVALASLGTTESLGVGRVDAFTYDGSQPARVEVDVEISATDHLSQINGSSAIRVERWAAGFGASTTPSNSLNATNTVDDVARVVDDVPTYGSTPGGRPYTKHYGTETGPQRNIPGSVVDEAIDNYPGKVVDGGKTVHYDPANDITVVTGNGGSIVSVHKGQRRAGQR